MANVGAGGNNNSNLGMYTGTTKTAKYAYQSSRAIRGLGTTTRLTAAVDILAGSADAGAAHAIDGAAKGVATTSKGVAGAAKLSKAAKVAKFAGKAAPVLTKGSCILGAGLGGYEIGQGINNLRDGNKAKGKEQLISGTADVVTSGALAVAATSAGTVVGLPVAGVALGVAGVSQAAKYGYKYRGEIAKGAKYVGNGIANGAKAAGRGIKKGASWVGGKLSAGWDKAKDIAGKVGENMAEASRYGMYMPY